jgi:FkbM family methyltransferase
MAEKRGLFDRIVCFEPDPTNMGQLRANLFLNRLASRIEAIQAAVSDVNSELPFEAALPTQNHRSTTRVVEKFDPSSKSHIIVPSIRLDDWLQVSGRLLVMKIDVDGYELKVFEGARRLLKENDCVLQVEILPTYMSQVTDLLGKLGYSRVEGFKDKLKEDCLFTKTSNATMNLAA